MKRCFSLIVLSSVCVLFHDTNSAFADENDLIEFDITQKPLARAIQEFAKRADVAVSTPPLSFKDGESQELQGQYSIQTGLTELLRNTSLNFEILSDNAIRIFKVKKQHDGKNDNTDVTPKSTSQTLLPEEIIVSARRKTETIATLPSSASVFSPDFDEQFGRYDTQNISRRIAGAHNIQQLPGQNKLILRGLSDGAFNGRAQTLVSTYVDDSRIIYNAPDPGLRLIDIERVEVLRGPQGTLFGSGALSGLYRIVTKKPDKKDFSLQLASSVASIKDGGISHDHTAIVNIPIISDKLAVRGVGLFRRNGGYIDDIGLDLSNVNSSENIAVRAGVTYQLSKNWEIDFVLNFQDFRSADTSYFIESLGPLNRDNNLAEPYTDNFIHPTLSIKADLGWANFRTSTAYLNREINSVLDASPTIVRRFARMPDLTGPFTTDQNIEAVSNETHLISHPGGRFEWILGTFFSLRSEDVDSELNVPDLFANVDFGGISAPPSSALFFEGRRDELNELALFGEATYFLSDEISLTTGLRWFKYDGDAISLVRALGNVQTFGLLGSQSDSSFLPKFAISYFPSDNLSLFGLISVGRRLGGTNLLGSSINFAESRTVSEDDILENFESDKLVNYEIGLKFRSDDGNLSLNTALYYSTWDDIQSYQFSPDGIPDIANVGDATVIGLEADFSFKPLENHWISANIAWNTSEITRSENRFGAQVGDRLPGAPAFTAGISSQYDTTLLGQVFSVNLDYNFVGNAQLLFQQGAVPQSESYHLVNARIDIPMEPFHVSIFATNLFNSQANTFPFANPFNLTVTDTTIASQQVTPLTPRTVGISANWNF